MYESAIDNTKLITIVQLELSVLLLSRLRILTAIRFVGVIIYIHKFVKNGILFRRKREQYK